MKNLVQAVILLLSLGACISCQTRGADARFIYSWTDADDVPCSCMLEVQDSVVKYYPDAENRIIVRISKLNPASLDSVRIITDGLNTTDNCGSFAYGNVQVEYEVNRKDANEVEHNYTIRQLSNFLLRQIGVCPSKITAGISLPAAADSIYNDGRWNTLQLKVFAPDTRKCLKELTFTPESVAFREYETELSRKQVHGLTPIERDSLSQLIRHINLNVEYQYWDGVYRGREFIGCPEAGVGLYIDGKCLALILSIEGMPTKPLEELFEYEYTLSPQPLYIYTACFNGIDLIWDKETDEDDYE